MFHIPYKGTGQAVAYLIGGNVDMSFATASPLLAHIRAGKMRALTVGAHY